MSKRRLHSENKVSRPKNAREIALVVFAILFCAAVLGALVAYRKLRSLWIEQCAITDPETQIEVVINGKTIQPDAIREGFGLVKGANLWQADFEGLRRSILDRRHNIRDISISRRLPSHATIFVTEREPVAKVDLVGAKKESHLVADSDGVVFPYWRRADSLPTIKVPVTPGLPASGQRLAGNALAALRLVEAMREPEFQELGIREIHANKPDFLWVTLGNYQRAKVAWEGMDAAQSAAAKENMLKIMRHLRDAINADLTGAAVVWNATEPGKIYADTKEPIK